MVNSLIKKLSPPALTIIILFFIDISFDIHERTGAKHLVIEVLIYLVMLYIAYIAITFYKAGKRSLQDIQENLSKTNVKLHFWQDQNKVLINGLSKKIHEEFLNWGLSKAERDVAILIIKGFSLVEIASFRGTSERTVRDQATSIYHKAKLKNRVELSAYFLEDMLAPIDD